MNADQEQSVPQAAEAVPTHTVRTNLAARLQHWTGVDRAIAFTIVARGWGAVAGVVSVLLIAHFLTPDEQGYYYTFYSLVALQIVFELGFSFVLVQLAAHERARLSFPGDGSVTGESVAVARLASVLRLALRWYSVASLLMFMGLLPAGIYFFSVHRHASVQWQLPWCLLVSASSVAFLIDPVFSFLEGCGYVADVAQRRMTQAILGSLLAWTALILHHGLYAPALVICGQVLVGLYYLLATRMRHLLSFLLRIASAENTISWRREVWPFQWRIAISWLCGYFIFSIFNPVLFAFCGPVEAGRMGMSLGIVTALQSVAFAWMNTKASPFGALVAERNFATLDRIFFRTLWQSTILLAGGSAVLFAALMLVLRGWPHFAVRVLDPAAFVCLLLTVLMLHLVICQGIYLRAHKREPFLVLSVIIAVLVAASTVLMAWWSGANAVAAGYMLTGGALNLIFATSIFLRKRREWHDNHTQADA